jgi:histidine ammonia-lyase
MSAAQALDFRRPLKSSPILEKLMHAYREEVAFNEVDRLLHTDMIASIQFLKQYQIIEPTL